MRIFFCQPERIRPHRGLALAILAVGLLHPLARAADEVRETPLSTEEELATFKLADSRLVIELVASEPQLDSPVAISWDADGRLYVAEMIDYPLGPTSGRVRLLEDRDHDGRYEQATVFASGLNFPNGVLAASGGVFVTAAPDLLFLRDTNGDGVADEKRVVFTGFAEGNQQLRANGLTWGLDNWIHGANGRSGGEVRRPNDPPEKAVSIRSRDFRFRPDGSAFEATSGQSQFGQASDDWGNRFLSWNTIPIRQALFEQDFLDRNPLLANEGVREIAEFSETGRVFPISPRPTTFNKERTDYYNALCGLAIFRGDALGRDYLGNAFVGESLSNLVHRRLLTPEGPSFVSRRGEHGREFLASTDSWFHPVYMTTGPDGALYIVDFYRRWVEHPQFVAESLRPKVDWRKGAGHGRLWKVSRRENTWPPPESPHMSGQQPAQWVKYLESANGWWRDTAQRLLLERNDPQTAPILKVVVSESRLPQAKLHALAVLEGIGQLDDGTLLRALDDGEERVRQFAMKLSARRLKDSVKLREAVVRAADFPSPIVRFQIALTLGAVEGPDKVAALVKLANREAADPFVPMAIVGSVGRSMGSFLSGLMQSDVAWRRNPTAEQMRLLAAIARRACSDEDQPQLAMCLNLMATPESKTAGPGDVALLTGVSQGLSLRGQSPRALVDQTPEWARPYRPRLVALVSRARALAAGQREPLSRRMMAVELLGLIDSGSGPTLVALLDPRHPQELQTVAAVALEGADAATAESMLASWSELTTTTRRAVIASALRSVAATTVLVTALEEEKILPRELDPTVRDALLAVRDPALAARIAPLMKREAPAEDRQEVIARFAPQLEQVGKRMQGAVLFEKHCLVCHSLQGRGARVGPDLSGIGGRAKQSLLVDLFDPNKQVTPDFTAYTLVTRQGQVMTGLVVSETAASVTLRRAEGAQDVVLRTQIEALRSTGKSLMPEGFEQHLSPQDVADLLAFLTDPDARLLSQPK